MWVLFGWCGSIWVVVGVLFVYYFGGMGLFVWYFECYLDGIVFCLVFVLFGWYGVIRVVFGIVFMLFLVIWYYIGGILYDVGVI